MGLDELPSRLAAFEPRRDRALAVMGRTNCMSGRAVELLRKAEFRQPLLVEDGMHGWREAQDETRKAASSY